MRTFVILSYTFIAICKSAPFVALVSLESNYSSPASIGVASLLAKVLYYIESRMKIISSSSWRFQYRSIRKQRPVVTFFIEAFLLLNAWEHLLKCPAFVFHYVRVSWKVRFCKRTINLMVGNENPKIGVICNSLQIQSNQNQYSSNGTVTKVMQCPYSIESS